jgi:hypothetical protein
MLYHLVQGIHLVRADDDVDVSKFTVIKCWFSEMGIVVNAVKPKLVQAKV